ncbi:transcriptional adapter 1-like isoform X2 [Rhopilema esculentum]|uniref:transcriptional adapter 1-like isoform X2 n=1 Tax=Rhopilema esculentum TaxID=499914 RepID=UPI0031D16E14
MVWHSIEESVMADVELARKQLLVALGEFGEKYWNNMKLWYKQKITKDDFDNQAFQLLGPGKIHLHNEFLLAILARCHALITAPASLPAKTSQKAASRSVLLRKPKVKRPNQHIKVRLQHQFEAADPLCHTRVPLQKDPVEENDTKLCSVEVALPDVATLHGRLYLGAWEHGLNSVAEDTASLLSHAVEAHLKNILTACIARRRPYRLRDDHFLYSFGTECPAQRHNFKKRISDDACTADEAEAAAVLSLASNRGHSDANQSLSTFDLRDTLQANRSLIPSHTVRASNMERILAELWHPGHEEIEQNQLYKLETKRFNDIVKQQRGLRA